MSEPSEPERVPPRPYCLPGCNRLDGHDGRDPGACTGNGGVLVPGPLDLVHRHPDIPVPVPVRNVIGEVLSRAVRDWNAVVSYDAVMSPWGKLHGAVTPFRDGIPRAGKCYRAAAGFMVHVKPGCRCG